MISTSHQIVLTNDLKADSAKGQGKSRAPVQVMARLVVVALIALVYLVAGTSSISVGQDVSQKVFKEKKFPWYDAENDGVKRIELGQRPGIDSADRNKVPLKPLKMDNPNGNAFKGVNGTGAFLEGMGVIAWLLIGLVVAGIGAALFWAFMKMNEGESESDDKAPQRTMEESIKHLPFDLDVESGDFRQAAQKAYAANDFRNAIIFLFSHVLVSLDQKNLIRLRKGKTNRQYLSELRPFRPLSDFYQRVMVPFESTFFGDHDLERQEFENCWNRLDTFQNDVDQTSQVSNV